MISLDKFAGGALVEKFNTAMNEVAENIYDPNTNIDVKRKLIIEITLKCTDEDRNLVGVEIATKTKLAPLKGSTTKILIDKDHLNGNILATEFKSQIFGQNYFVVDEVTGEVIPAHQEAKVAGELPKGLEVLK